MGRIVRLKENQEFTKDAALWFSEKWEVPAEAYLESIEDSFLSNDGVPNWYIYLDDNGNIIGGCGVIENDFHSRTDLRPNLCALYVEENHRGKKIAEELLDYVVADVKSYDIELLYLVTDLDDFYESKAWSFFDTVIDDDGYNMKIYVK